MKILILATLVPLCGFYFYVLVNFQRELRRARQEKVPGAKTIPLYWRDGQLSDAGPVAGSAGMEPESPAVGDTRMTGWPLGVQRQPVSSSQGPSGEIYQFESVYLGPFLLIPLRNRKEQRAQQCVTQVTARRAG
jgi:hypothetical protein